MCLAFGAIALVVIRACTQSITLDEATSFLLYSRKPWPSHWFPSADNHVLNSILMRLVTSVFGVSELTVRTPALLGASVYVAASLYLSLSLAKQKLLQLLLFICLVYNPFVLDYLVTARGYGLAVGLFLAAIALIAKQVMASGHGDEAGLRTTCFCVSCFLGLSFSANFSFAIADGVTLLVLFFWAARTTNSKRYLRIGASCFLPGTMIAAVLCGSVPFSIPRSEFYYGSTSMAAMWGSLMDAWFDEVNPVIVSPVILRWMVHLRPVLPCIVVITFVVLLAAVEIGYWRSRRRRADDLITFTRIMLAILAGTLMIHWLLFHTEDLLLPKYRTGLFFIPLLTLVLTCGVSTRLGQRQRDSLGICGVVILTLMAIYFIGCVRLGYFKEWKFDSDTKHLYWLAEDLRRRCNTLDIYADWRYEAPLNFYREAYGNYALRQFTGASSGNPPAGHQVYLIFFPSTQAFISQQRLQVLYHNAESDSAVAVRGCSAGERAGK